MEPKNNEYLIVLYLDDGDGYDRGWISGALDCHSVTTEKIMVFSDDGIIEVYLSADDTVEVNKLRGRIEKHFSLRKGYSMTIWTRQQ